MATLSVAAVVQAAAGSAVAQEPPPARAAAVDSAFALVRLHSVHRARPDWSAVERAFRERLARAPTLQDSLAAFGEVFEALGDVHSSVHHDGRRHAWWRPASGELAARVAPLVERADAQRGLVDGRLIGNEVGYVVVPTIYASPDELADHADAIRDRLCRLSAAGATRWIVDLRLNMGGNVHPMLTGLGPLLADGEIGGFVDAAGRTTTVWSVRDGVHRFDGRPMVEPRTGRCGIDPHAPVAVLVGPVTMSSGQMVAVAFAGRPQSRSFGTDTADGYATANEWMEIAPGLALNLAVAFVADRTGRVYPRTVEPDVHVAGTDDFDDLLADSTVQAAIRWLAEVGRGAGSPPPPDGRPAPAPRTEDAARSPALGGAVEHRLDLIAAISGVLPDRSIVTLRARSDVLYVEAGSVACLL